jgi:large subunit ribosomal protein L29
MATLNELRLLSPQELEGRAGELRRQIFDMRNKHSTGVLDSTAELLRARRDVARCLTVKREKELGIARETRAEKKAK